MSVVVKGWKGERTGGEHSCKIKVINSWAGFVRTEVPQGFLDNPRHPQNPLEVWLSQGKGKTTSSTHGASGVY